MKLVDLVVIYVYVYLVSSLDISEIVMICNYFIFIDLIFSPVNVFWVRTKLIISLNKLMQIGEIWRCS